MAPAVSGPSRSSGSSARSEISTLPWRRWRSQSRSVSKCSPCAVRTTSPLMSCSMWSGRSCGVRRGVSAGSARLELPALSRPAHFRSMRAILRRNCASCSWISSIRFFFAYDSPPWPRYQVCSQGRGLFRCGLTRRRSFLNFSASLRLRLKAVGHIKVVDASKQRPPMRFDAETQRRGEISKKRRKEIEKRSGPRESIAPSALGSGCPSLHSFLLFLLEFLRVSASAACPRQIHIKVVDPSKLRPLTLLYSSK